MSRGSVDRVPVSQLPQRYDIARSAVYKRMEDLGVKPKKVGNRAFLEGDHLQLMDDLHAYINRGGTTPEFLERHGLNPSQPDYFEEEEDITAGLSTIPPDIVQLVSQIAGEIAAKMQFQRPQQADPLAYFKVLEEAARFGWLLKTSEVGLLLELTPAEVLQQGDRFAEAGFTFTQSGYRAKGEVAWKVSKGR